MAPKELSKGMIINPGKYYLYRHIRLDKNEPFYIGIGTKSKKGCYDRSYSKYGRNPIWKKIINKTEFVIEILMESNNKTFIKQKEVEFIKLYGKIIDKTGILANMSNGGDGSSGYTMSNTQREKISISKKGSKGYWKGKKLLDSAKVKMSNAKLKTPIIQLDLNNVQIKEWISIMEASRNTGISHGSIISAIRKGHISRKKFKWVYKTKN